MTPLEKLEEWYKCNCNGDWEHQYGITISTIDNPGWDLKIDLTDTCLEDFTYSLSIQNGAQDWMEVKTESNVFIGYGDPNKLTRLIDCFFEDFFRKQAGKSTFVYEIFAPLQNESKLWRPVKAKMIDLCQFEIIEIPPYQWRDLKAVDLVYLEEVKKEELDTSIVYASGEKVKCELIHFFDYPSLAIQECASDI